MFFGHFFIKIAIITIIIIIAIIIIIIGTFFVSWVMNFHDDNYDDDDVGKSESACARRLLVVGIRAAPDGAVG